MSQWNDIPKYFSFLFRRRWVQIFVVIVVFCVLYMKTANSQMPEGLNWWENWLDPIIGVGTLLIAAFVWFTNVSQERAEDLAKKLTVRFFYEGNLIMLCENAYLSDEGDIRAWGQQIGSQMSHKSRLDFKPFIREEPVKKEYDENDLPYYLYQVSFYLNALPEIAHDKPKEAKLHERFTTEYRWWKPNKDNPEEITNEWVKRGA